MKTNQAPNQTHKLIGVTLLFLALSVPAWAQGLTNNFDVPFNYLATGIIGDTNWDGVYLAFGDVFLGNNGGDGNGLSTAADANISVPSALTYQGTAGSWAGAADDGFFLWKYVTGDFDASVEILGPYPQIAYQFAGLMCRLYNTNNSGSPFSYQTNTPLENQTWLARFQQFGNAVDARWTTNGVDMGDNPFAGSDTNRSQGDNRFYRITRVGSTFAYYYKTNAPDAWSLLMSTNLPTLSGPVQVGIMDADFTGNSAGAVFQDFELVSSSLSFPALPAAPSALVTTATNTGGSLTFSWALGHAGDSSLVTMKAGGNIQGSPIKGLTYAANAAFGDTNTLLSVGGQYVVYNGTGTSVTVTNLAGSNTLYTVAVYEYTNPASPVYNTASPATNTFPGPGIITGVAAIIAPTNMPVGGAVLGQLFATFSTGTNVVDESASATWTSSDPTIAAFTGSTLTALQTGSVTVQGQFGGFIASQVVNIHAPVFTDNFAATHDYIANGIQGSTWDGLFLNFGDVPGPNTGPDNAKGACSQFIAETNVLYVDAAGSSWYVAGNDGPYLYKIVTGDFQASVHIGPMSTINNCDGGIMARLFNNSSTGSQGGGGGAGGSETHINWIKIQNGQVACRRTIDSGGTTIVNGLNTTDRWLLMQRVNSTNFYLYEGSTNTAWQFATRLVVPEAANNAPMQVGLEQEMRSAADGFVPYDTLMIDGPGITPPATPPPPASNLQAVLNGDLSMTFSWVASDGAGNPVRSGLIMRANGPITAFPTLAQAGAIGGTGSPVNFGLSGVDCGGGNWLTFVTGNPASSTNVTCTVKGLSPGVQYYAAVITFVGSGGNKSFNTVLPASGATTNLQDGALLGITAIAPGSIPLGGVGKPQVLGAFQGGALVDISAFATFTPSNTAVIITTNPPQGGLNGILTGVGVGSSQVGASYKGFTSVFTASVRAPKFTDNFSANYDYLANGVGQSGWDGMYNTTGAANPIPQSPYVAAAGDGTTVANANISSNGVLTITQIGAGWENDNSGGFFLFKYVPGDFQAAVHINFLEVANYNQPGILARAYTVSTNGLIGAPLGVTLPNSFGTNDLGEYWVDLTRFDEFGIGTYARLNEDSVVQQSIQLDQGDGNFWLLVYRSGSRFNFYKRATNTAPWVNLPLATSYTPAELAGQPMQVGLMAGPWFDDVTSRSVGFDTYLLDWTSGSPLEITQSGPNVIVSWPPIPGTLQKSSSVNPTSWLPVSGTPSLVNGRYQLSVPIAPTPLFFRLVQ